MTWLPFMVVDGYSFNTDCMMRLYYVNLIFNNFLMYFIKYCLLNVFLRILFKIEKFFKTFVPVWIHNDLYFRRLIVGSLSMKECFKIGLIWTYLMTSIKNINFLHWFLFNFINLVWNIFRKLLFLAIYFMVFS